MANYKNSLYAVKKHLEKNENIQHSIYGAYETKIMGGDASKTGIFVATEKRIVFFGKKLFGFNLESFPFKNISSIEKSKGMMGHSITFYASGNKAKMKWINKGDVEGFTDFVNSKIGTSQATTTIIKNEIDIPTQIEKLSELKDKGILTEEEFNAKKSELLAKL